MKREVTIVAEVKSEGGDASRAASWRVGIDGDYMRSDYCSLSFVVVVLRGVVIARERRESSCQYDRRTFVIVESFLLERVRVVGQFIEDSSKIYIM